MEIKDLDRAGAGLQEKKEAAGDVDFKMVTFSLGGKDYGVDIMNIKEIARAGKFTFVPNSADYVRGVYNLRGDIIPVIDLRLFFHLPVEEKIVQGSGQKENMLILRIEDRIYGTVVDKINRVLGVHSSMIQPNHPFFCDINIKYISGVVEYAGDLYIILDVLRIFSLNTDESSVPALFDLYSGSVRSPEAGAEELSGDFEEAGRPEGPAPGAASAGSGPDGGADALKEGLEALKEALPALAGFTVSPVNEKWVESRFAEWCKLKAVAPEEGKARGPLADRGEAEEFLSAFYSPFTDELWGEDYAFAFKSLIGRLEVKSSIVQVWNPGCGRGLETYSLACILKNRYPGKQIRIWANDNDILKISGAPNMKFKPDNVPGYCKAYMVKGSSGWSFNSSVKDAIIFEYHDVMNDNILPKLDLVVARDFISFLPLKGQSEVMQVLDGMLNEGAVVMPGENELMPEGWEPLVKDNLRAFVRADRGRAERVL